MGSNARPLLTEDELWSVYHSLVRYWTKRGFQQEAEDLAQEGLHKCLLSFGKWEGRKGWQGKTASIRTFFVRVGINKGKDYLRKEARQARIKQRVFEICQKILSSDVLPDDLSVDKE
jgi:DNA-directed RNA polymerase specialized sigma24 family protein